MDLPMIPFAHLESIKQIHVPSSVTIPCKNHLLSLITDPCPKHPFNFIIQELISSSSAHLRSSDRGVAQLNLPMIPFSRPRSLKQFHFSFSVTIRCKNDLLFYRLGKGKWSVLVNALYLLQSLIFSLLGNIFLGCNRY